VVSRTLEQAVVIRNGAHPGGPETRTSSFFRSIDTSQPHFFSISCRTCIPVITALKTNERKALITSSSNSGLSQQHEDDKEKKLHHECILSIAIDESNNFKKKDITCADIINAKQKD
jgi:hypothetical protein